MTRPRLHAILSAHMIASYVSVLTAITIGVVWQRVDLWVYVMWPFSPILVPLGALVQVITWTPDRTWFVFWPSYLLTIVWAYRVRSRQYLGYLRRHRIATGYCTECGYDLWASTERCPECGTAISFSAEEERG